MKVLIKRHANVYGAAMYRSEAISTLSNMKDTVGEHIIKCVVYHDERPDTLMHWVKEISACLKHADKITGRCALKERDYLEHLFGSFGDTREDAEWTLDNYQFKNERRPEHEQYPEFEITDELVNRLYAISRAIIGVSLPWLMSKTKHSMAEWTALISPILI